MSYDWGEPPTPGPVVCTMQISTLMTASVTAYSRNERLAMTAKRAGYRKAGVGTRVKSIECTQVATIRWFE